jgi:RNA polymerase sigma-70 factor (ECF subfamily)
MTEPGEAAIPVPQMRASDCGRWCAECWHSDLLLDELLDRAAHGDELALQSLVAAAHPMIVRYCRARLGGARVSAQADDVAHEIDIAVRRILCSRRIVGERLPGLVYGIALRKVAEARHESRHQTNLDQDSFRAAQLRSSTPREKEPIKLRRLPEDIAAHEREVLVLRIPVGLSCERTAQTLGVTLSEVLAIQHRVLDHLRYTLNTRDEPR